MDYIDADDEDAREKLARGLFCMPLMETAFTWEASSTAHNVKRYGFMLTHAYYLTTTASQGQTLRGAVTIDSRTRSPRDSAALTMTHGG